MRKNLATGKVSYWIDLSIFATVGLLLFAAFAGPASRSIFGDPFGGFFGRTTNGQVSVASKNR